MTVVVARELVAPRAVGASEVGAVLGCDPWTTPLQLWRQKLGLDVPRPDNERMALGRALEGPVVQLARARIPEPIRRNRRTFMHPGGGLFATPDAFVGRDRLLEAKVVGLRSPDALDDDLPCRVRLQVQAQLAVTGRQACYVAQLVGTELRLTTVERDPVVVDELLEAVAAFVDLLEAGVAPDPLTWDERWSDLLARMADGQGELEVLAGGAVQAAGDRILAIRQLEAQLEDETKALRLELLEALVDAGGTKLVGTGWTGSLQERAGSVDWRGLAQELLVDLVGDGIAQIVEHHRGPSSSTLVVRSSRHAS